MNFLQGRNLKTKIFLSTLVVIVVVSVAVAILTRWIMLSSLTTELKHRGVAIAQSVADRASAHILDHDTPGLVTLVFDTAQLEERKDLVAYVYVTDDDGQVLAHTFTRPFPEHLLKANVLPAAETSSVDLLRMDRQDIYDCAVPITEGIYRIGTVHAGLSKGHIDQLLSRLRLSFFGFLTLVVLVVFLLSLHLAGTISKPIQQLISIADSLSRGNFDVGMDFLGFQAKALDCPAYRNTDLPCWHFDQPQGQEGEPPQRCKRCDFYRQRLDCGEDEVAQLADSFRNMVWSIKLYRRRLRESEEKYRSLFHSGPDPLYVVDRTSLRILDANPRAQELYGFEREELLGLSFTELDPDFPHDRPDASLGCVREGERLRCDKILHYRKDGTPFFVNMRASPTNYQGLPALMAAATDVTEMMEKDAQLIQASKMKTLGEMSAGVAHELNQPLNAIKLGSDYLSLMTEARQTVPMDTLAGLASTISSQVDRATEIITTLRGFGRKADLVKEKLDVNRSIRGVMNLMAQQLVLSDIAVDLDLGKDLPCILAHDNRLQQVLFNLVSNARDAVQQRGKLPSGEGRIAISSAAENGHVLISVADTGVGIPAEELEKVFEPFYTTKETGQGMGLGLAITYGIVKDYGGNITIESTPGQGTAFVLSFPGLEQDCSM